jgi:hypothetical protein
MYLNKLEKNEYPPMRLPCGGTAWLDPESSTYGFRCNRCFAVVGSIGQPRHCKDEADKWEVQKTLGGRGWNYQQGEPN